MLETRRVIPSESAGSTPVESIGLLKPEMQITRFCID